MRKVNRKELAAEWIEILRNHPEFARSFLAQQAILMDASRLGYRVIDRSMCQLLETGLPVLFEDFWIAQSEQLTLGHIEVGGVIGCLSETSRDPARCFSGDDADSWFDDPLAGGHVLPPKPPDPHVR